ncbi:NTP transferase domain-containing protein [Larkinella insperata]|uniref:Probable molybdenum cofactor guanylyltransferase n=1 Tax=Larkinella insperata TaxID=332158 RepID=A0ABW3QJE8_9BACT|nr:NTP transferase domain-containing protein [Larkinella insperata]
MTSTRQADRPVAPLLGLVLVGGRSTRMGVDKSRINYHGKPQFEYLHDLLAAYCEDVFLSVNAEQADQFANSRFKLLVDQSPVAGPLAGILTAFQRQSAQHAWLVVVCDLPLLSERSIRKLTASRNPEKLATAFWDSDHQFPEPSICIWEPTAYPAMLRSIDAGKPYPRTILMQNDIDLVEMDDISELTNVNTPDQAASIRRNLQAD